jgi:hypothetical protein
VILSKISIKKLSRTAYLFASMAAKFGSAINTLQTELQKYTDNPTHQLEMNKTAALHGY